MTIMKKFYVPCFYVFFAAKNRHYKNKDGTKEKLDLKKMSGIVHKRRHGLRFF